jgi:hypothetical protein
VSMVLSLATGVEPVSFGQVLATGEKHVSFGQVLATGVRPMSFDRFLAKGVRLVSLWTLVTGSNLGESSCLNIV